MSLRIAAATFAAGLGVLLSVSNASAQVPERYRRPVRVVADHTITVPTSSGPALFGVFASEDWSGPQPDVTRVVIIFHGLLRNAADYLEAGIKAREAAGAAGHAALVLAPQFLADFDIPAHHLPPNTLGWNYDRWAGGEPALTPSPVSGFAAIDALLAEIADRSRFPALKTVVMAGFSAGAQTLQRYAIAGNGDAKLVAEGIKVSYVVSDPSSYLYFTADRPTPQPNCPRQNAWRYGFDNGVPAYVNAAPDALEARYAKRDVTYLLGMADTDPNHPVLDKTCAGEAQGPQRVARTLAYFEMMKARHPTGLNQRLIEVPGIAHEGQKMFNSACGLAVLFDAPGCPDARVR